MARNIPFDAVRVLGIPVHRVTENEVVRCASQRLARRELTQIATINAEFVMLAQRDPVFRRVLNNADVATPDGAGVVWAMRRRGVEVPGRVGGSDLVWSLSRKAAQEGKRVFLLGAGDGIAGEAAARLRCEIPDLSIAGTFAGSPAPEQEETIVDLVRASAADILFVAFGAPAQDVWLARNLGRTGAVVGMGVGGTFDYLAGRARRAPVWMQEHALDWLWRLLQQPWRWRRMLVLPRFAWSVIREGKDS